MKYVRITLEITVDSLASSAAKYFRCVIGFPRQDVLANQDFLGDTLINRLNSVDLKEFSLKEDFNMPVGGTSGAVDTSIPGIIKLTKTFKINQKISWPTNSSVGYTSPVEIRRIP